MLGRCKDIIDRVSAILDGEAGALHRAQFTAHLAMCSECRTYLEQFKLVRAATAQIEPADLPDDFGRVMDFVLKELDNR